MAIAYARADLHGERYRDLLELCLRDHPATMETCIALTRRLFPDVPISLYAPDEIVLEDLVLLARMAVKRRGRVLPVLSIDRAFHPDAPGANHDMLVLGWFGTGARSAHSFWDPEPADIGSWRISNRVDRVPPDFQCTVFGWLPPATPAPISRKRT
jgi:hypothetical protein